MLNRSGIMVVTAAADLEQCFAVWKRTLGIHCAVIQCASWI